MDYVKPADVIKTMTATGATKANLPWRDVLSEECVLAHCWDVPLALRSLQRCCVVYQLCSGAALLPNSCRNGTQQSCFERLCSFGDGFHRSHHLTGVAGARNYHRYGADASQDGFDGERGRTAKRTIAENEMERR